MPVIGENAGEKQVKSIMIKNNLFDGQAEANYFTIIFTPMYHLTLNVIYLHI